MSDHHGFAGPKCWALSASIGIAIGFLITLIAPAQISHGHPAVPLWLVAPFGLLLSSIALMPFIAPRFWHTHYPDFAFLLGGVTMGYYLFGFTMPHATPSGGSGTTSYGIHAMLHAAIEYYSFIALVGGLFVVSGTILIQTRARGNAISNGLILVVGAILANLVGTTGASMLLIRPFMRINHGRLHPLHVVLFILVVSNCGGSLTPIGDPPLYLGFLKGVPFFWTLGHLWPEWLFVCGCLVAIMTVFDMSIERSTRESPPIEPRLVPSPGPLFRVSGGVGVACLALMVAGVFIDPMLKKYAGVEGIPIGATFQLAVAIAAYRLASHDILAANDFSFGPVREVACLFAGIFAAMVPALAYLAAHGKQLGIDSPTAFYFGTGALSAVLDNAPTYLNFLQVAIGPTDISPASIAALIADDRGNLLLSAISTGAVFFGAMTYIGNGPNFMVKAIAESAGVPMPSFFGYLGRACLILLPILVINWALFIR
ncbi:MAG: sodium:proton antiporter [Phycisphaerales bacterium]